MTEALTKAQELLPCPFCGGVAQVFLRPIYEGGDVATIFRVGCQNENDTCGVVPGASVIGPWGYRQKGDLPDNETARRKAIAAWNRRAALATKENSNAE